MSFEVVTLKLIFILQIVIIRCFRRQIITGIL